MLDILSNLETKYVAVNFVGRLDIFDSDFSGLCRFHSSFAAVLLSDDFWFSVSSVNFGISSLSFSYSHGVSLFVAAFDP